MPNRSPHKGRPKSYGRRPWQPVRGATGRRRSAAPPYRHRASWPWPWVALATVLCLAAFALTAVMVVHARASACRTPPATLIDATQVTAEEGYSPAPPAGLVNRAEYLASCSGGTLIMLRAAGQGGQADSPVTLRLYREPGQLENDSTARASAIRALIGRALGTALATPGRGDGRDLIGLLAAISQDRGRGGTEVWLATLGLPTVAPADTRILMAADPVQAARIDPAMAAGSAPGARASDAQPARWRPTFAQHGDRRLAPRLRDGPPAGCGSLGRHRHRGANQRAGGAGGTSCAAGA